MRLIDADELLKPPRTYRNIVDCSIGEEYILKAPTIEAQPVVHGKWIKGDTFTPSYRCSCCGYSTFEIVGENIIQPTRNYCSHCGAKMDAEE